VISFFNAPVKISEDLTSVPGSFELFQNYPNPFNPSTNINFSVSINSHVTLKVFNSLGEETAILCNEEKEPGRYSVYFSAEGLPSGIYFYQITAGSFSDTKKMIHLK
jgi:hypothetical protein